ncbi:MAG: hypothetical protein WCB75_13575 [Pseudolabrys sp.]
MKQLSRLWQGITRRTGLVVLSTPPAQRSMGHRRATFTVRSRIIQGQTMPKKAKMEIKIAFLALAFFAAFMAGRSLTAYFKQK